MYKLEDIKVVHLEVTQKCQAACPMCDRNKKGGDINPHINLSELSLTDCQMIFNKEFIAQLKRMYMCGNLGDPIIANDTLEIFKYFRQHNEHIDLSMNTNAGARDSNWWKNLASIFGKKGHVIFSVDGLRDTNHLYRQNVSWDKVENSMRSFIAAGGNAVWEFIVFEHNQHQIDEAKALSESMGFSKFTVKKTARFFSDRKNKGKESHQSYDRKGNQTIELKKPNVRYQNSALSKEDSLIKKYGSMDFYYDRAQIRCKVKEEKSLFITAEGLALPCCWTAGRMYKWRHADPKIEPIWNYINSVGKENLDARNGLDNVFSTGIFDNIENGWKLESCAAGKLKICAQTCGTEFDAFMEQYS
jgi:MoaA/NifB/PqqE/SkfB family radical SAM enzyme